jgi:hypothetical protein
VTTLLCLRIAQHCRNGLNIHGSIPMSSGNRKVYLLWSHSAESIAPDPPCWVLRHIRRKITRKHTFQNAHVKKRYDKVVKLTNNSWWWRSCQAYKQQLVLTDNWTHSEPQTVPKNNTRRHFMIHEVYDAKWKKLHLHHFFLVTEINKFKPNFKWLAQAGKVKYGQTVSTS